MNDESPAFSRGSTSSASGKCTERIDVPCTSEHKEKVAALAIMLGYGSTAEFVRFLIEREIDGSFAIARRSISRQPGVAAMGGKSDD